MTSRTFHRCATNALCFVRHIKEIYFEHELALQVMDTIRFSLCYYVHGVSTRHSGLSINFDSFFQTNAHLLGRSGDLLGDIQFEWFR